MARWENTPFYITAYDIAVKWGFEGSEEEWLNSLTAFALAQAAGYKGTAEEWLADLNDPVPAIQVGQVTTLEGGSNATAEITGDKRKPVLHLGIPRGLGMSDALPLVGGTMKGDILMAGFRILGLPEPEEDAQPATRKYADRMLPLAGGTMKGHILMGGFRIAGLSQPVQDNEPATKQYADRMLPKDGGTMTGMLSMGGNRVSNLADPVEDGDAVSKGAMTAYVDGRHAAPTVTLAAADWVGTAAPYTQTVTVQGILDTDIPHWGLVHSSDRSTALAEQESFALVDYLDTENDRVIFTCLEYRPEVDLVIQMEVNR